MNKRIRISLTVIVFLLISIMNVHARDHGRVRAIVSFGPVWGPEWWVMPYSMYYPYFIPPSIVMQQPELESYEPSTSLIEEPTFWYYCQNPKGYYPYVKQCPSGWLRVVPFSPPLSQEKE